MTNKQYEHLGRALMLAADLAQGVENLYETRTQLQGEIGKLIGNEEAKQIVQEIMQAHFPVLKIGTTLIEVANKVTEVK